MQLVFPSKLYPSLVRIFSAILLYFLCDRFVDTRLVLISRASTDSFRFVGWSFLNWAPALRGQYSSASLYARRQNRTLQVLRNPALCLYITLLTFRDVLSLIYLFLHGNHFLFFPVFFPPSSPSHGIPALIRSNSHLSLRVVAFHGEDIQLGA